MKKKRKPLTRYLSSPDLGLTWHFRIVATLPEDHRPFWGQKLKQKAVALAKQERKVASLPADQVGKRCMWRLRKELAACYADLIEHRRQQDAKSATRILRAVASPVVWKLLHFDREPWRVWQKEKTPVERFADFPILSVHAISGA